MEGETIEKVVAYSPALDPMDIATTSETEGPNMITQAMILGEKGWNATREIATEFSAVLLNPDKYQEWNDTLQRSLRDLLGDEQYEQFIQYALPTAGILLWTLIVLVVGYFLGHRSKRDHLEGEMMKTQAKLFRLEHDLEGAEKSLSGAKKGRSRWNTRFWLLLLLLESTMGVYYYFFHNPHYFPRVNPSLQYAPLIAVPVIIFVLKGMLSFYYGLSISRGTKRMKSCFLEYAPLREKYHKLMEENNHAKVMRCVQHLDRMKKDFESTQGVPPTVAPQQPRLSATPSRPTENLPKPEIIPASQPQPQTPQLRGPRALLPHNQAATAPPMRQPIPASARATPASPYAPPNAQKKQESSGFLGSAVGFIAGSPSEEPPAKPIDTTKKVESNESLQEDSKKEQ